MQDVKPQALKGDWAKLLAIADLAEKYAGAEIRTTVMQNFVLPHVPFAPHQMQL